MSDKQGKYNIKAICNVLGIQPGTLRAWERRYQIIRPVRNSAGHRLYTEEHLKILKWLIEKIHKGFTISQAVSLLETNEEINAIDYEDREENEITKLMNEMLESLLSFNETKAHKVLDYAFSVFSIETVTIDLISPALIQIGNLWETNKITSAHEHFATNFLRSRIGMMLISMPVDSYLPKAICVCGPNERHELGLLIFTLYLKRQGYDVIYLGQSIAPGDIDTVIEEIQPTYLFMSCTMKKNIPVTVDLADKIKEQFPSLRIGLGGYAYDKLEDEKREQAKDYVVGGTPKEWKKWLTNNQTL